MPVTFRTGIRINPAKQYNALKNKINKLNT